ncbi:hypothetical protein G3M48_008773 [Beauveria asiatica]|uniref:PNPLA domain-containing protein n=1 Tax=Beauveria asiatica TaxID=1069075 RepID=A0AAW0RK44_9HYPO
MEHNITRELNPVDREGLCLLSLDGGGVRGLSTLFILKGIMARLNYKRKETSLPSAKPCEVFDLIRGTSTGGRLEMDIDECISTFVCAAAKETSDITRLRSYDLPGKASIEATILDAALATSAATRFFDPVRIGARQFVDGALGANNPVEQVEREAVDRTPTTFASIIRTVPFERNLRFVRRASLLNKLEAALFTKEQPSKISLFGLGGVGKTQVALELAYRTREKYTQCSVIWIPANNTARLRQAYIDAAEQLGIAVTDDKSDVKQLVKRHLSQDSAGRWLLIYDNADDLDVWIPSTGSQDSQRGLLKYVPGSSQGCVVFTTRSRKIAGRLSSDGLREEVTQIDDDTAL